MKGPGALVLEISRQGNLLTMSIFEQGELSSTVRHYSELQVSFIEINKLCREVISILNRAGRAQRCSLPSDYIGSLRKAGQLLWGHLLTRAVKDRLNTTIIRDLVLFVDEELINMPWELLYDGNDFLCLKFNLGRLVRTKGEVSPAQYRSLSARPKMLILANPTSDLKSAYLEGINIKNQFDRRRSDINIDFKSTHIDKLYVKKNIRDYDIVHFAGHCEFDEENPKNTGWVLSDGRFSTADILALGESFALPNLIFSNACHSAESAAELKEENYREKNYSLASAFLFSGVRHYIGTVWKIEDSVSLAFAREFYSQLIKGHSVGECMRLGRLRLVKEYGIAALSWAGYLLYGNPDFVLFKSKAGPSALKLKRDLSLYKNEMLRVVAAAFLISITICLYFLLPAKNPGAYVSFFKSRKLFLKGNNQEVIRNCNQIIKNDPFFLSAYPLLAETYQRLGDRTNALRCYFDYAISSEKRGDKSHLAFAYIGIAWVYHQLGEYPKAFDFYNKALMLSGEFHDKLNEGVALRKLAVWYMDKDNQDKALELLMKSSEINRERARQHDHMYNLACDYFDMGLVFTNKDDFAAAREFYDKSSRIFEKLKLRNELSDYYFNLGEIALFEKQYQKALDYYTRGLKADELHGNKPSLASDYNMIGELYVQMDDLDKAEGFFSHSISISREIDAPMELAAASYNIGLLYKKKGENNKAREYLREAFDIYRLLDISDYQEIKKELLTLRN